ncbi:agamous-like MADS-box protein AGL62 [Benincasa hispida]|uniref:agamous-like MADS-box protein AGL62 n=1 Tax=Benincasa hispida TaxID=102211 RepID=UPI001901F469|nr:agamous-like MADS-box protein AGL62 [Benincasa hispida]
MKKSLGRQKIEIKKLEVKSRQQVTFSKRRAGLFNKAAELSILCGAEIAILVFSPTGKIYTFGHPNVDLLLDRSLTANFAPPKPAESYLPLAELNRDFDDAMAEFEIEKRRAAEVERMRSSGGFWWDEPVECMGIEDLKRFRSSLVELRGKVAERVEKLAAVRNGGLLMPAASFHLTGNLQCAPLPPFHLAGNHSVATEIEDLGLGFL